MPTQKICLQARLLRVFFAKRGAQTTLPCCTTASQFFNWFIATLALETDIVHSGDGLLHWFATQRDASAQCCVCGNVNVSHCCVIQPHVCHCALASISFAVVLLGAMGKCGGSRRVGVTGAVAKRIGADRAVTKGKRIRVAGAAAKQIGVIVAVPKHTNSSGATCFSVDTFTERLREFVEHFHRRPPRSTALGKRLHLELKKKQPRTYSLEALQRFDNNVGFLGGQS